MTRRYEFMVIKLVKDTKKGYYKFRFKSFSKYFNTLSDLAQYLHNHNNIYLAPRQISIRELKILGAKMKSLRCKQH